MIPKPYSTFPQLATSPLVISTFEAESNLFSIPRALRSNPPFQTPPKRSLRIAEQTSLPVSHDLEVQAVKMGSAAKESAMDEIQWRNPAFIMQFGPLHTNTVLHYFATSPFFDPTSNNNVIQNQAQYNANLFHVLATREAFETRLKSMQGLEYIVAEQPAETGPGQGTGVWVIRKQNRRKRPGQEDELTVHKDYFLVGENLYAAPTFADLMSSRMVGYRFCTWLLLQGT